MLKDLGLGSGLGSELGFVSTVLMALFFKLLEKIQKNWSIFLFSFTYSLSLLKLCFLSMLSMIYQMIHKNLILINYCFEPTVSVLFGWPPQRDLELGLKIRVAIIDRLIEASK